MDHEGSLTPKSLEEYLIFTLSVSKSDWDSVTSLIGENCATNKSMANSVGVGFVGCASHRFNLDVQDIMADYK